MSIEEYFSKSFKYSFPRLLFNLFKIREETKRLTLAGSKSPSNLIALSKYLIASFKSVIGSFEKEPDLVDCTSALEFCSIKIGYEYF